MLIIGTSNKNRFINISSLVHKIDPNLDCIQKELTIDETGITSEENSLIKVMQYYKNFHTNILCVDDAIDLEDKSVSPGTNVRRDNFGANLSSSQVIKHWMKIIKMDSKPGKLIKSFALINKKGEIFTRNIVYDFMLVYKDNINFDINPLNNFIVPQGFNRSISDFTEEDTIRFRERQIDILRNLLIHIN